MVSYEPAYQQLLFNFTEVLKWQKGKRIPTSSQKKRLNKLWQAIGMNLLDEYRKLGMKYSRVNYELESEIKFCLDQEKPALSEVKRADWKVLDGRSFELYRPPWRIGTQSGCCQVDPRIRSKNIIRKLMIEDL